MTNTTTSTLKIQEYVAEDYRTADVFNKYGIDFCCRGHRTLDEVCVAEQIDKKALLEDLANISSNSSTQNIDYKSWPLDLLIDYIEKKHHRYVAEKSPVLRFYLDKIAQVHGDHHPELHDIRKLFYDSSNDLLHHQEEEEGILFPYIKELMQAKEEKRPANKPEGFEDIASPIEKLMAEHDQEGVRHRKIAKLSNNYTMPADGCNTYKVTYELLKEFQDDLHLHIHLENNILFLEAKKLEAQVQHLLN